MTPDQALSKAMDVIDQHVPLAHYKVPQLAASIALAFRAALRERDAEHEIALKKARADALSAAARQADAAAENYLGSMGRANKEHDHTAERLSWASMNACRYVASRIRALLEEAGK